MSDAPCGKKFCPRTGSEPLCEQCANAEVERLKEANKLAVQLNFTDHAEIERLRAACDRMMIGGNHIALYKTEHWPDPGTDCMVALEKIGAGQSYDMWCCWNAIMEARRALEKTP